MFWWILVAVVVVGVVVYACWPRKGGISDRDAVGAMRKTQGQVEPYSNPSGPNFGGPF